jgi:hypothetical protein
MIQNDFFTNNGNKRIAEFTGMGYEIFTDGKIRGKNGKWLKLHTGTSGYIQVNAYNKTIKKTFLVHRLVASAFIPNPLNLQEVNHKDGNKLNNSVLNLEWVDRSTNIKHGISTGLIPKSMPKRLGEKHWRSKPILMVDSKRNVIEFESAGDAERKTGFSRKTIYDAVSGRLKTYKNCIWKYKE